MRKRNKKRLIRTGFFYLPKGGYHSKYYSRGSLHPKNHRIQMRYLSRRQEVIFKGLVTAMNKGAVTADKLTAALEEAFYEEIVFSPGVVEVTVKEEGQ